MPQLPTVALGGLQEGKDYLNRLTLACALSWKRGSLTLRNGEKIKSGEVFTSVTGKRLKILGDDWRDFTSIGKCCRFIWTMTMEKNSSAFFILLIVPLGQQMPLLRHNVDGTDSASHFYVKLSYEAASLTSI